MFITEKNKTQAGFSGEKEKNYIFSLNSEFCVQILNYNFLIIISSLFLFSYLCVYWSF